MLNWPLKKRQPNWMVVFVMSLLTLLQGCSAIQLGYNNGATLVHTYISSQIDLEPEQSLLLKDKLVGLIEWHRMNELPVIAQQLKAIEGAMQQSADQPQKVTPLQVAELNKAFQGTLARSAEHLAPALAEFMLTFKPEQLKDLQTSMDDSNSSYRKKWLPSSKAKQVKAAVEGMETRLERWYGRLGGEQKLLIQEWANAKLDDAEQKYNLRIEQQKAFMQMAGQAANRQISKPELTAALIKWFNHWQTQRDLNKGVQAMANQDLTVQLVVDVSNLASIKQRKHAAERAGAWAEDFTQLARGR